VEAECDEHDECQGCVQDVGIDHGMRYNSRSVLGLFGDVRDTVRAESSEDCRELPDQNRDRSMRPSAAVLEVDEDILC